jgi:hypothetical protein
MNVCSVFIVASIIDVLTLFIDYLLCMPVQQCCAEKFRFYALPMTIVLFISHVAGNEQLISKFCGDLASAGCCDMIDV